MSFSLTLILAGMASAFAVFCGWRGARRPDFRRGPRLIPWRVLMLLSATLVMLLALHLVRMNQP